MAGALSRERALLIGLSTVAWGMTTLFRKLALEKLHPFQYEMTATIVHVAMIPVYVLLLMRVAVPVTGQMQWATSGILWVVAATLINVVGTLAFLFALRQGNDAGFISSLAGASPIITVMLSALFLGETPGAKQAVGIALVLLGVIVASGK